MKSEIKKLRLSKNLSIRRLSQITSVNMIFVAGLESGETKSVNLDYLKRLVAYFDVDVSQIISFTQDELKEVAFKNIYEGKV